MRSAEVPLDDLLLDPNNYRLQELAGFSLIPAERFALEQVQKTTLQRLQRESLKELRASILANGFLPIERIVVTPHGENNDKFLIIEGNRRVAALKSIQEQISAGIEVPAALIHTLSAVPCVVVEGESEFPYFKETLMGIRHVGGIRPWGGYQRAKLIADLKDNHGVEAGEIADKLGLSVHEVNRRYRALKALQQMQESEEFGDYATPNMYPLFHEAVALPAVRSWLGWNSATNSFDNDKEKEEFYQLITPHTLEETGTEVAAKLGSFSDVRELKNIIGNTEAMANLLDIDRSLLDALTITRKDELSRKWRNEVSEAKLALEKISALEVKRLDADEISAITSLRDIADQVLDIHRSLSGG